MDFLRGKLTVPRPSGRLISRPRVVGLLDGVREVRLALLSAPPGFGKSSAVVDWLDASGTPHAWLTLDPADNDPARLLRHLWAACSGAAPPQTVPAAGRATFDPSLSATTPAGELVAEIVAALAECPDPWVLVLDDVHAIDAPAVQGIVEALVDHLPPHVHLVMTTREDPPLRLSRLRVRGELLELRADALRFTADEGAALFAQRLGLTLDEQDVATLVARTEGWPAALQLAGLSLVGRDDPSRQVRSFAATHRLVLDYVTEEVLGRLDAATLEFLLRTSVLDRLTGDLCDAVTAGTGGAAILERLERANLLLVPLDEHRSWYRYHRLFADLLRARARTRYPGELADLHLRAGGWYQARGFAADALEHAVAAVIAAGDLTPARDVVAAAAGALIHTGDLPAVRRLLDRIPEDVGRSSTVVAVMQAWARALTHGTCADVESWLDDARAAAGRAAPGTEPLAPPLPGLIAMIRSVAARHDGRIDDAVTLAERALALEPPGMPPPQVALYRGDAQAILGHALLAADRIDAASDVYRAAIPLLRRTGNQLAVAEMTRNLARLEGRRGRPDAGLAVCQAVLGAGTTGAGTADAGTADAGTADADIDADDDAGTPSDALVLLAQAELLLQLGCPDDAADSARRAHDLARRGGDLETLHAARAVLVQVASPPTSPVTAAPALTPREVEVLGLVALGRSNRQIAEQLYLTVGTVKSHVHAIAVKLDAANRVEAVVRAREMGLLRSED